MAEKEVKLKQLIIRLPENMHTWLKDNVKDGSINDFVVNMIKAHIEGLSKEAAPAAEHAEKKESEEPLTDAVKNLLAVRKHIFEFAYLADEGVGYKQDYFLDLERKWLRDLEPDDMDILERIGVFGEFVVHDYFEPLWKLSDSEKRRMYYEVKKAMWKGDPSEIVYKDITREKIFDLFEKGRKYQTAYIAGKLGLDYQVIYNKIVPWMVKNGFNIA
jgi:hypothetical protein